MKTTFKVEVINGFAVVRRPDGSIVCDGRIGADGRSLSDIAFSNPADHKNNRTRQAAMKAYQSAGYR